MNDVKVQTKRILSQLSDYFSGDSTMTKPEKRCLKEMTIGVLKSKSVFVNQIAASLREPIKLKKVTKRLSEQYLKEGFAAKVREGHLDRAHINKDDFIVLDGSDISKKYAKYMEGLEPVRDGDTGEIGLGYNVINVNSINASKEITPIYSKAYSYEMGGLSSNNETKKAVRAISEGAKDKGSWVVDRGMDNEILKNFFFSETGRCIVRLKKNTKLTYKGESLQVAKIASRAKFITTREVLKTKKNRKVREKYDLSAVEVSFRAKGKTHSAWLVVTRNMRHGGLCYLLVKTPLTAPIEVAEWAFSGYGKRWKIEEYHRHIKQEYHLEDIQIRTYAGLQSMLAILTVAMHIVYRKTSSIHFDLLLGSGYNYLNKHTLTELTNFAYYKISKILSHLLMPVKLRWKVVKSPSPGPSDQLNLLFN